MAEKQPDPRPNVGKAGPAELSSEALNRFRSRLDEAIKNAQFNIDKQHRDIQELQARLARLHDAKRKIAELSITADDIETIEGLAPLK